MKIQMKRSDGRTYEGEIKSLPMLTPATGYIAYAYPIQSKVAFELMPNGFIAKTSSDEIIFKYSKISSIRYHKGLKLFGYNEESKSDKGRRLLTITADSAVFEYDYDFSLYDWAIEIDKIVLDIIQKYKEY